MATLKTLAQFKAAGGIVSRDPILRHIKWTAVDPSTLEEIEYDADVALVKLGAAEIFDVFSGDVGEKNRDCYMIHKSWIVADDEKAKPRHLTYEEAEQLDPPLKASIIKEIFLFNGLERKNSQPKTSSGAISSDAALVVAQ